MKKILIVYGLYIYKIDLEDLESFPKVRPGALVELVGEVESGMLR